VNVVQDNAQYIVEHSPVKTFKRYMTQIPQPSQELMQWVLPKYGANAVLDGRDVGVSAPRKRSINTGWYRKLYATTLQMFIASLGPVFANLPEAVAGHVDAWRDFLQDDAVAANPVARKMVQQIQ
jgi:hypothetical protein